MSDSVLFRADFTRGMLGELERAAVLDAFGGQGLVTDVLGVIGDGKEATVYCCAADPSVGVDLLAAKVYRARKFRAFSNARSYRGSRTPLDARSVRALEKKTRHGKRTAHGEWIAWEWHVLCALFDAGGDVPEPLSRSEDAILMEFLGDASGAAPQLRSVPLDPLAARGVLDRLLGNVERLLDLHLVHGDLSAYNVLYSANRPCVIDLPQAVDARTHPDAYTLLHRDVANLCSWARSCGVEAHAARIADALWSRYRRGALGR